MKNLIFLFIPIFVYVDADVYTIQVQYLKSQNEEVLSITNEGDADSSEDDETCLQNVVVHEDIPDTAFYDGSGTYVDTEISKAVQFCNVDVREISGTMSYILLYALGVYNDDEIACPVINGTTCLKNEAKMVSGNFAGIFNTSDTATLEIHLPNLIRAAFSISRQEGLPIPESETDSSADEQNEIEEEIQRAEEENEGEGENEEGGEAEPEEENEGEGEAEPEEENEGEGEAEPEGE